MYYSTLQYIEETTTTSAINATYQTYSTSITYDSSYSSSTHYTTLGVSMTNTYYSKYTTLSASNSVVYQYNDTMSTSGSSTYQSSTNTSSTTYSTSTVASSIAIATNGIAYTYISNGNTYISSTVKTNIYNTISQVVSSQVDTHSSSTHSYTLHSGVQGESITFMSTWQEFGTTTSISWTGELITGNASATTYNFGTYSATTTTYRTSKSVTMRTTSSSYSSGGGAAMTSVQTIFHGETETIYYNNNYFYAKSSTYTEAYGGYKSYRLYSGITTNIVTTISSSTYAVGVHNAGTYSSSNFYNSTTDTYFITVTNTIDSRITYSTEMWQTADSTPVTVIPYATSYSTEYPALSISSSQSTSISWSYLSTLGLNVTTDSGPWILQMSMSGTFLYSTQYTTQYTYYRGLTYSQLTYATTYYTTSTRTNTSYTNTASTISYTFYYCSSSIAIASDVISTVITNYSYSSSMATYINSSSNYATSEVMYGPDILMSISTEYSYSTQW